MPSLNHPYIRVETPNGLTYGGSQMLSPSGSIRRCGCGPVAALDTVWYLTNRESSSPLPLVRYNDELSRLCRQYFPLIPPFCINGVVFVLGLNRLLRDMGLPYRATWMLSGAKLWPRVDDMLKRDLPVILSVGPNFPMVWQNNRLPFYRKTQDGQYRRASATNGHFVTATGIDDTWLRISSWGREYYIKREEYDTYTQTYSTYAFSNLVYLDRK